MSVELPKEERLHSLLDLVYPESFPSELGQLSHDAIRQSLDRALFSPLQDFLSRSGKRLRAQLVELGAAANSRSSAGVSSHLLEQAEQALEAIHAGSMVVDDIEDESALRRGMPTLHRRFGLARALNSGNWLYFFPLEQIRRWGLSPTKENTVYRLFHSALLRAHFGQALDVGVPIDEIAQKEVAGLCLASLELKSGALTELAVSVGAALASDKGEVPEWASQFGRAFGTSLQMFDDIGNLAPISGMESKRYEDFRLRRPSWIWAEAARVFSATQYSEFIRATKQLPNAEGLERVLLETGLAETARESALKVLSTAVENLLGETSLPLTARVRARELENTLVKAYG